METKLDEVVMTKLGISQFKANVVEILTRLAETQDDIIITKQGKPLARITPYHEPALAPTPGKLADTLVFEEDIVSPLGNL
ncbi:MAG: type II toxin-antitoxin system Phd/YefM family antitoxin [bacterium]|nr:type II toxin-antitoxin system Phd/YefM family antitoxin [bacterium]